MKRLFSIVILIVFLVVPFASTAVAETIHPELAVIEISSSAASQLYAKSAIRIFSLIIAGLVITGVKALFKSNTEEKKTNENIESEKRETPMGQSEDHNEPHSQESIVPSDADDDGFGYEESLSQTSDASIESLGTQEVVENYSYINASNDVAQEDDTPKFCRKCGNRLLPDSIFCDRCGTKVK